MNSLRHPSGATSLKEGGYCGSLPEGAGGGAV